MEPLLVPGTVDSLAAIREYVAAAASTAGLDARTAYRLMLAVDEIATNSVVHGYAEAGIEGMLVVQAHPGERTLTIVLEDTGVAYRPDQHIPDDHALPLEQRRAGGLGLFLASGNVDSLRYERIGDRNRHTFSSSGSGEGGRPAPESPSMPEMW